MKAEVIDLKSENSVCEELGDFPLQTTGAFGALLGNYPIVCGGDGDDGGNKCYKLDESKQFTEFATMTILRKDAGIILHENGVWMTGGRDEIGTELTATTEFILASGISVPGPDLPHPLTSHAMAKVNLSTSMIIGGYYYDNSSTLMKLDKSWYFDHHTGKFSDGPGLLESRWGHTAGVITDSVYTQETRVLVVGGIDCGNSLCNLESVEWLVSNGTWEQGKKCLTISALASKKRSDK